MFVNVHQVELTTIITFILHIKFAVGERNVAIVYSFCVWLCNMNVIIVEFYNVCNR